MTEDLAAFFNADEFATAATYKANGSGTGVSKNIIFDRAALEQLGVVSGAQPVALGVASDFADLVRGSATLLIGAVTYRVTDVQPQDDGALVLLILAAT